MRGATGDGARPRVAQPWDAGRSQPNSAGAMATRERPSGPSEACGWLSLAGPAAGGGLAMRREEDARETPGPTAPRPALTQRPPSRPGARS